MGTHEDNEGKGYIVRHRETTGDIVRQRGDRETAWRHVETPGDIGGQHGGNRDTPVDQWRHIDKPMI